MTKKLLPLFGVLFFMYSCGSSKKISSKKPSKHHISKASKQKITTADKIVWTAVSFKGVPYKYGGTNKKGMDCSGLIYTSFKKRNISLPRTSKLMYLKGDPIPLNRVKRGDLLFFKTTRKRGKVNHVGLITSVKNGVIRFIHSTSSRGVLISSLREKYWKSAFIKAKRVL